MSLENALNEEKQKAEEQGFAHSLEAKGLLKTLKEMEEKQEEQEEQLNEAGKIIFIFLFQIRSFFPTHQKILHNSS